MRENDKVKEAKFFLNELRKTPNEDLDPMRYRLSAFLSAGRSVLQYAMEEAEQKPGWMNWYKAQLAASKTFAFFKDKRDANIHRQSPASFRQDVSITVGGSLRPTGKLTMKIIRGGEFIDLEPEPAAEPGSAVPSEVDEGSTEYRVSFADWTGQEDLYELCELYVQELGKFVSDGIKAGYISG